MSEIFEGKVRVWNEGKGWGFIRRVGGEPDVFVHRTNLVGLETLCVGDEVRFEIGTNHATNKQEAKRVTVIAEAE